jgi:hypothetical protein
VVVFYAGADGTTFWSERGNRSLPFLKGLRAEGLTVVQVRWVTPWLQATRGEDVGPARLACRPATVARWIHDEYRVARGTPSRPCGFCISGQSGGASQVAYALARYGLDRFVDVMIPTSGPPHAAIQDGCAGPEGRPSTFNRKHQAGFFDVSYGFLDGDGPCARRDASYVPRWTADSVEVGGDYDHPDTTIRFVFGGRDSTAAPYHALRYVDRLRDDQDNRVTVVVSPCMAHGVQDDADGLAAIRSALLGTTEKGSPSPSPSCKPIAKNAFRDGFGKQQGKTSGPSASPRARGSAIASRTDRRSNDWGIVVAIAVVTSLLGGATVLRRRGRGAV